MKHLILMIKKRKLSIFSISLILIVAITIIAVYNSKENDRLPVTLKAIQTSDGWGYEIAVDGKTFIRQSTVPAINGNIRFTTKEEALLVGKHAIAKLKTGKMPQITVSELKEWGIVKNNLVQ